MTHEIFKFQRLKSNKLPFNNLHSRVQNFYVPSETFSEALWPDALHIANHRHWVENETDASLPSQLVVWGNSSSGVRERSAGGRREKRFGEFIVARTLLTPAAIFTTFV